MRRRPIDGLHDRLQASSEFVALAEAVGEGVPVCVEGVSGAGSALLVSGLLRAGGSALVVTYNDERARRLADDLRALLGDHADTQAESRALLYPSIASALYDGVTPERAEIADRLTVLERLCAGDEIVIVASVQALMLHTMPRSALLAARREIRVGEVIDRDDLARALLDLGYERVDLVDEVGQFSVRGGIVDISCPAMPGPARLEFFGDEVESLRLFDPITQRSVKDLERAGIGPAGEILLTEAAVRRALPLIRSAFRHELDRLNAAGKQHEAQRLRDRRDEDLERLEQLRPAEGLVHYLPYLYPERETLADYLPEQCLVVVDEPVRVQAHGQAFAEDAQDSYQSGVKLGQHLRLPETACVSFDELAARHLSPLPSPEAGRRLVYLNMLRREVPWQADALIMPFSTPPVDSFGGKFELLAEGLDEWQHEGKYLLVSAAEPGKVADAFRARGVKRVERCEEELSLEPGKVVVADLDLSGGFKLPTADLIVLTAAEIYGWRKLRRPQAAKYQPGFALTSLREIHEGDLVVHINHGIGRYVGLSNQKVGDVARDYLVVEYAGADKIYVPVTQLDRVQRYAGSEGARVELDALKGKRWERAKSRARKSARLLAAELMKLYREREQAAGFAFSADSPWLEELEASFRYEETPDQWRAIQDVKGDMRNDRPGDRLVCGDVGFGKTEIAIRAAFKAVLEGKQAAVLAPTTVLAHQHLNTFRERLHPYPVEIRMLSRFRSRAEQRKTIEGLRNGSVDIVIGTHRLLVPDVQFRDLGLLVIDEEQRFGVKQKEELKRLRIGVDVITLTATPIPRTLNMALSGIRDISLIHDPPPGRLPIRTFVRERDDDLIREAMRREIDRGGQVYFVHNRVHSIPHVAAQLQRLVPDATVAVAHGQMPEDDLEQVMMAFYAEEFDVLCCTTIVENGLDVPSVNTILIDDADRLGLAQLYQLRGRVGRSNRQAYAYLLYRYPERMTEEAEERLKAIEEFSELGSGFQVALRDLEIRGAGDILGREQSGHVTAVGLDMYCQMLAESVKALKGEQVADDEEGYPALELPLEAVIPSAYVPGELQRIALYRRLASVHSEQELEELIQEVEDRYGELPGTVRNLMAIAHLKLGCREVGITDVRARKGRVYVRLSSKGALSRRERLILEELYRDTVRGKRRQEAPLLLRPTFEATTVSFVYDARDPGRMLASVREIIDRLRARKEQAAARRTQAVGEPA